MATALHRTTHVLPGHKVTLDTPELDVGTIVEVIIRPTDLVPVRQRILDILEDIHARIPAGDPEEMDRRWRDERDAWDR